MRRGGRLAGRTEGPRRRGGGLLLPRGRGPPRARGPALRRRAGGRRRGGQRGGHAAPARAAAGRRLHHLVWRPTRATGAGGCIALRALDKTGRRAPGAGRAAPRAPGAGGLRVEEALRGPAPIWRVRQRPEATAGDCVARGGGGNRLPAFGGPGVRRGQLLQQQLRGHSHRRSPRRRALRGRPSAFGGGHHYALGRTGTLDPQDLGEPVATYGDLEDRDW
mmetsp:Transcript_64228/g.187912  ORF Transcript_64228/g.187912 Transcript_64228/m.187912 type:complete len:220 (+) Transcript_64228:389-1048(+)